MKKYKYHYFYKITNLINEHYYYGIHSTNNLNDGYFGSGHRLKLAIKQYGKENFKKEILKFFDSREQCSEYESLVVNENCVFDIDCYNLKRGGDYGTTIGTILTVDENGVWQRCKYDDDKYINGTLKPFSAGKVTAYDIKENKYKLISIEEYKKEKDVRYIHSTKDTVLVKNNEKQIFRISLNDERYLSGELVPVWKDRKHSKETREKMCLTHKSNKDQQGERNSQYGTCWVYNEKGNIKIKKEELQEYLNNGYIKGRVINQNATSKYDNLIDKIKLKEFIHQNKKCNFICEYFNINKTALYRFRKKYNI